MRKFLLFIAFSCLLQLAMAQGSWLYPQNLFPFEGENGKIGFTDAKGKLLILPKYDEAREASEGLAAVKSNGKWGYIDETGKESISPQYEEAGQFHEEKAAVKKSGKYGFINREGREVISFSYENAYGFTEGLAAVCYKGKFGFIDRNGKKVIPFEFDEVSSFSEGLAKVLKGTTIYDKQGFIDKTGKLVVPYQYDHNFYTYGSNWQGPRDFQDGLLYISKNFHKGYIDKRGKEIIPATYGQLTPFHKGWAAYYSETERKWGLLYKNGKEYTPAIFDAVDFSLLDLGYSLIITSNESKNAKNYSGKQYGLFSTAGGQILTLPYYDGIGKVSEGMIQIEVNHKYGYLDSTGRRAIEPKYDFADVFSGGTAVVEVNKKYGIINKAGREILPAKYAGVENFSEGLAVVALAEKVGYADLSGREVIPAQYADAFPFAEGIGVIKNTKYGFIDKNGKALTDQKYDKVTYFRNGISIVTIGDKTGVVNKTGAEIVPPSYKQITSIDGYLFFEKDTKWGVMNNSGVVIIPASVDSFIQAFIGDTAVAIKNGRAVYIDKTGKVTGEVYQ